MEAKGHEHIATTVGIPLLKELFKKAGQEFLPAHGHALYMGNWIRDLSQVIDPVVMEGSSDKVAKGIEKMYDRLTRLAVTFTNSSEGMEEVVNGLADDKNNMVRFVKSITLKRNADRQSDLQRILRFLMKLKAFYKFCQPDKENKSKIEPRIFYRLFDDLFSQYYPHEHLDRPEDRKEGNKVYYADQTDNLTRDPDDEKRNYLNIYSYLKDDIFVIATTLADVDREWACKFFEGGMVNRHDTFMNLAQIGRALHGVEDFFAHSNFVEHASTLTSASFMKENKIWDNDVFSKRLKRYPQRDIRDDDDVNLNMEWTTYKNEANIATGFFDSTDTAISLGHVLEEVLFGEDNESKIKGFLKKLETTLTEPVFFLKSKFNPSITDNDVLTEFSGLSDETIRWLIMDFKNEESTLNQAQFFKKDLESFLRIMSNPWVRQTVKTYATGYEYFKDFKEITHNPINFIYKKFGKWLIKKTLFFAADAALDYAGNKRIGSHSLMAKDTTDAFLYDHALNCAKAVHWYIIYNLGRWSDESWVGKKDKKNMWINWAQLCEFFLSHPFSDLAIKKEEKIFVSSIKHVIVDQTKNYDTLVSLSRKYIRSAQFSETQDYYYWEAIADANFDIKNQLTKLGITQPEKQREYRKKLVNRFISDHHIGYPVRLKPNYAMQHGLEIVIPFQKVTLEVPIFMPNRDKWFLKIMEQPKPKKGEDNRWKIFVAEQQTQGKFLDSKYHKPWYYKASPKTHDKPEDKVEKLISEGRKLQSKLEQHYRPGKKQRQ